MTDLATLSAQHAAIEHELRRRGLPHKPADLLDLLAEGGTQPITLESAGLAIRVAPAGQARSSESDLLGMDRLKQVVYAVVLEPDVADTDGHVYSAEQIEQSAHKYLPGARQIWLRHKHAISKANVVESYVAPQALEWDDPAMGRQWVAAGTWIVGIRVEDSEVWGAIERGEIRGVSARLLIGAVTDGAAPEGGGPAKPPVLQFNPYHDAEGKFAKATGGGRGTNPALTRTSQQEGLGTPYEQRVGTQVRQHFEGWAKEVSAEEADAVKTYKGNLHYNTIQSYARHGTDPGKFDAEGQVKLIDSAIAKGRVPFQVEVYRGINSQALAKRFDKGEFKPGDLITDKGYVSTSISPMEAAGFAGVHWKPEGNLPGTTKGRNLVARITLPEGARAAYPDALPKGAESLFGGIHEQELLLPRNTVFRVVGASTERRPLRMGGAPVTLRYLDLEVAE